MDLTILLSGTVLIAIFFAWLTGFVGGNGKKANNNETSKALRPGSPKPSLESPASPMSPERAQKPVLILYGSQTGTAEMFAKTLHREATQLKIPNVLQDVSDYAQHSLAYERLVVFVVATYGEGEPTDSMKPFYEYLMDADRKQDDPMTTVKYTVFGLGDKQYKHYCQMGVDVDTRMTELGAKRIYGLGCGDSGRALEEEFDQWRHGVFPAIAQALHITIKAETEEPYQPECKFKTFADPPNPLPFPKTASAVEPTARLPVYATVLENTELLKGVKSGEQRSTRHIVLSIADTLISYQAGDHLGIMPCNQDSVIAEYAERLQISSEVLGQTMSLQDRNLKNVFPSRQKIFDVLKWFVDLCGPPKKSTLRALAHFCENPVEKEDFLSLMRVNHDAEERYRAMQVKARTVLGFLRHFPSCKVPLDIFMEVMPRLTPRYFSIASDQLSHPKEILITVALVKGGVCTTMLANATVGTKIAVFVRKSNFHLPLRAKNRPVVMIGPGTGIAPLIGFCHRRLAWKVKGNELGEAMLFFGCRHKNEDFLYEDFLTQCVGDSEPLVRELKSRVPTVAPSGVVSSKSPILTFLSVAFSRDQDQKIYVQHKVAAAAASIWKIIQAGGNIYVCGDAKHMAKDVHEELIEICHKEGKMERKAAEDFLTSLEKSERYLMDVWSA